MAFRFDEFKAKKYRHKPVVVEAYPVEVLEIIRNTEGYLVASPGDYVIRGVDGELYPCKQETFNNLYEPADAETSTQLENQLKAIIDDLLQYDIMHDIDCKARWMADSKLSLCTCGLNDLFEEARSVLEGSDGDE